MKKILLFSLILITISKFSYAHYFSESYSNWVISDNKVSVTFTILKLEATRVLQIDRFQEIGQEKQLSEGEVFLVESVKDIDGLEVRDPKKLAYVTQTTLSVDDTADILSALKIKFPLIIGPHKEDICYATTNRQMAVKEIAPRVAALLVVGAPNSSNSKRLVEVASKEGCTYAQLIQTAQEIDWRAIEGASKIGVTAGASAPELLVTEVINAFKERFDTTVEIVEITKENVNFKVPRMLRMPA